MAELVTNTKVDAGYFISKWRGYVKVMSRTLPQAINDKLFMISRASLWFTHKADRADIQKTLGRVSVSNVKATGKKRYAHRLVKAKMHDAPLIALMLQKRMMKKEGHGYSGPNRFSNMKADIQKVLAARNRSVAYIKSGWVPAIKKLAEVTSIPTKYPFPDDATESGKAKGSAQLAQVGDVMRGVIENEAFSTRDKTGAFEKYGERGLQAGFDNEGKEIESYIAKKTQPAADDFNASQR